jgi:uncharacterized protein
MLTVIEAARIGRRNPETIRRWIREGKLRARKFGTQHMIDEDDLSEMLRPARTAAIDPGHVIEIIRASRAERVTQISDAVAPYLPDRRPRPSAGEADWLPAIVGRIVRLVDPLRIILFGSRANATARPDSDYDVLVVLDAIEHRRNQRIAILRALADLPISKDVIVAASSELEAGQPWGVLRAALNGGRTIYERP